MPKLGSLLVSVAVAGFSLPALAVLPQAGLWTIGGELNGEPGRGIQLDRQGGQTIVLSYFGYREDGTSMFLQAGGKLKDGKTFSGSLVEYKNGVAIGGTARAAELAKDYGVVTVSFDSTVSGTITLPGEQPATFSRFTYEDLAKRLNGKFPVAYTPLAGRNGEQYKGSLTLAAEEGVLKAEFSIITDVTRPFDPKKCTYEGDLVPAGYAFRSTGTRICDGDIKASNFRFEDLHVNEYSELRGRSYLSTARQGELLQLISGMCMSPENTQFAQMYCTPEDLGLTEAEITE